METEKRTITITCHLCGERFEYALWWEYFKDDYVQLDDGTYSGEEVDHVCDKCRATREAELRDWFY